MYHFNSIDLSNNLNTNTESILLDHGISNPKWQRYFDSRRGFALKLHKEHLRVITIDDMQEPLWRGI